MAPMTTGNWTYLGLLSKDISLLLLGAHSLSSSEVPVVNVFWDLDLGDVKLCGGGNQVDLIDTAEWAGIDLEGTWEKWIMIL